MHEGIWLRLGCFTKNGVDWLVQQTLISQGLEAGKSKIKAQADTVSGEGLFLLYPHMAESSPPVLKKGMSPVMEAPSSWPNYLLKAAPPDTITLESQLINVVGHMQPIAGPLPNPSPKD